jgi:hypothetical protein
VDGAGKFHLLVHSLSIFTGAMRSLKENIFPRPNACFSNNYNSNPEMFPLIPQNTQGMMQKS